MLAKSHRVSESGLFSRRAQAPFLHISCTATMTKYILVSGGVVSGIGKGVIGTISNQSSY